MLILADGRLPQEALLTLEGYGRLIRVSSEGITYPAISGHPDIFFCPTAAGLVHAPNTPQSILNQIRNNGYRLIPGNREVGSSYPASAYYNAFVNNSYFIHNSSISDSRLAATTHGLLRIHVKQGYTRCNLAEAGGLYITGDQGVARTLRRKNLDVFTLQESQILLDGCTHGFFGGCTGIYGRKIFVTGSLGYLPQGNELRQELEKRQVEIIELYKGPLWDAGSIIFVETNH